MSRIGIKPVAIPQNVEVNVGNLNVYVKGAKGKLEFPLNPQINVTIADSQVKVSRRLNNSTVRALHGLTRAMIANMITGVDQGFTKKLEMVGVGYRAQLSNKKLVLQLGFSHPVEFTIPEDITVEVPKLTQIVVKGIDKQRVGQVAADIRGFLPPEP
ncbi:MAG: 50S ribosomal protein L6, partial [Candidatus Omnitrophota bacterium]